MSLSGKVEHGVFLLLFSHTFILSDGYAETKKYISLIKLNVRLETVLSVFVVFKKNSLYLISEVIYTSESCFVRNTKKRKKKEIHCLFISVQNFDIVFETWRMKLEGNRDLSTFKLM